MFRDFSQEAKEKLISYVNDTSSDGIWQIIKNSIDYMDVKIKNWLHTLDSYAYLSQMDGYYQTVLNKHDTTIEQIEQIFTAKAIPNAMADTMSSVFTARTIPTWI